MKVRFFIAPIVLLVLSLSATSISTFAQGPATATVDEKSQQIIDKAIQALGGTAYRNVLTVTGKGFYTTFNQGMSQIPAKFIDYLAYPDHERTEFTGGGIR